jgi:glycolate oxidase
MTQQHVTVDLEALAALLDDPARALGPDAIDDAYLTDNLGRLHGRADALVFALSTEEVSRVLAFADERGIPVTPRGAGTNLVGSTVPRRGGIVLDVSRMNRVLEIDPDTFTATVEPGVVLKDFQATVEAQGLFYPPDPGEKTASIGGTLSTNAGGMRAVKYGVTRDYVRGLTVVLADGTVLEVGGKTVKDATGLSLKNLFVGSEGTLGVVTRVVLKLVPKPVSSTSVLVPFADLASGTAAVLKVLRANLGPTAVEFMERSVVELGERFCTVSYPYPEAGSYILLTFDGQPGEVAAAVERVRPIVEAAGAQGFAVLDDPQVNANVWLVRGELVHAVEAVSEQEPVDIVVPIDRTAEFIAHVNAVEAQTGVRMVAFGHAGDGNVHLCVVRGDRDDATWAHDLPAAMERVYKKAFELGGLVSGEHGVGISKRRYFEEGVPRANREVMNRIKDALDPRHTLNAGISYANE